MPRPVQILLEFRGGVADYDHRYRKEIVAWLKDFRNDRVTFTFHGGEPLLAGADFYRQALPMLSGELAELDPGFCHADEPLADDTGDCRRACGVPCPLGSSIDGPEEITDSQRGDGYFAKCMKGYGIAKAAGLQVRFICTFTNKSVKHREEIFNFFKEQGFVLKLHPALPSLRSENPKEWALEPEEYGELLVYLLDKSLENIGKMEVMNINDLCRCVFTRAGSVCTFVNCMGSTFAIGPDGSIYPCYRFVGMPEWVMGNVREKPTMEQLMQSEPGKRMTAFSKYVDTACKDCSHIRYCRGGCPYNAIAPSGGSLDGVDPHCVAYKRIFDELRRAAERGDVSRSLARGLGFGAPVSQEAEEARCDGADEAVVSR